MNAQPCIFEHESEHLCFERLLADLARRFVGVDSTEVHSEVGTALKLICETLGIDCSTLALWDKVAKDFVIIHSWTHSGFEAGGEFKSQHRLWLASKILQGEEVHLTRVSEFHLEDSNRKEDMGLLGPNSAVIFPLRAGSEVFGGLAFSKLGAACEGPEPTVDRLRLIADVLSGTLAHTLAADALFESQERLRLAADSADLGLWTWSLRSDDIWASERTFSLIGQAPGEVLTYESFLGAVHPEDRAALHGAIGTAALVPMEFCSNFRVLYHDGTVRWMNCRGRSFADANRKSLHIDGFILDITDRKSSEQELRLGEETHPDALAEAKRQIAKLKETLKNETVYLHADIKVERNHQEVVGQSQAIRRVLMNVEQVAPTDSTVLLLGETGTGKELIARAIHRYSKRKDRLMVKVNCAALPATLVENELFGREKGAYTGALTREIGRFELAHESTIFLDEIGELPLELQSKLLRVLQEGEFERLGSSRTIRVNARLIVATSRDLEAAVREGRFREDLYYRLNVFPIQIPPLRERREDIPMLTWHFLRDLGGRMGREVETVRASTMKSFECYSWPGNVRELRNVIERHLIIYKGPVFEAELPTTIRPVASAEETAREVERNHIHRVLERTGWRIRGQGGAAQKLDLKPTTLESRMRKLGIVRQ